MAPRRTPEGTWEIRWRDAARKAHRRRFKTKEAARQAEIKVLSEVQAGTFVAPAAGKVTLRDWSESWLTGAHNLRPKTKLTYRQALDHILPALGDLRLAAITTEEIDTFLLARLNSGASPSTVHRDFRTLRRMFKLAVARQKLARSPMVDVIEPRIPQEEMLFLTAAQLERVAVAIDERVNRPVTAKWRTMVLVAGWGGLRWGELAGLEVRRIDIAGNRLQVASQLDLDGKVRSEPKTDNSRRWVTLPPSVTAELAAHVESRAGDVWTMPGGRPLHHSNWSSRIWHPVMDRLGLGTLTVAKGEYVPSQRKRRQTTKYDGFRFHDLRHTAAALAIKAGAHPKAIQKRMGHSSIQVTLDRYGHLYPEMDEQLAADLDAMRKEAGS